jgi:catechol 2,3-dioxygenase-like lactoylglutathione lyase family enzyme
MPRLLYVSVADSPETWAALGFTLTDSSVRIGTTTFVLEGADPSGDKRGIIGWTLTADDGPIPDSIDGLPTGSITGAGPAIEAPMHPNGINGIDHLVVSTPNLDRTVAVLEDLDIECRRRRDGAAYGQQKMRQAFFWLGDVILEVVGPETGLEPTSSDPGKPEKPASFFGIALTASDLAATQAFFGDLMKPPVEAVQPGRLITTISSRGGSSLAIAVMNPHMAQDEPKA